MSYVLQKKKKKKKNLFGFIMNPQLSALLEANIDHGVRTPLSCKFTLIACVLWKITQTTSASVSWSKTLVKLYSRGFPGGSDGKESACNAGVLDSIPGLGRFPGEGNATLSSIPAWRIPWTEESSRPVHGITECWA